jgi:Rne/Rng family ribonuclease
MSKELVISAASHERRVAILEEGQLVEIYIEREKEFALVGSIYKGRVTRVLPGMQSAFVDIGLDGDAFLYVSDVFENLEDYDHGHGHAEPHASAPSPISVTVHAEVLPGETLGHAAETGDDAPHLELAEAESLHESHQHNEHHEHDPHEHHVDEQDHEHDAQVPREEHAAHSGIDEHHDADASTHSDVHGDPEERQPESNASAPQNFGHQYNPTQKYPPRNDRGGPPRNDRGGQNFGRGDQGGDRGGDRGRGRFGRRGGRRRGGGRPSGPGGPTGGRNLPPSKYASPQSGDQQRPSDSRGGYDSRGQQPRGFEPRGQQPRGFDNRRPEGGGSRPVGPAENSAEDEIILPGESLAKYRNKPIAAAAPVTPVAEPELHEPQPEVDEPMPRAATTQSTGLPVSPNVPRRSSGGLPRWLLAETGPEAEPAADTAEGSSAAAETSTSPLDEAADAREAERVRVENSLSEEDVAALSSSLVEAKQEETQAKAAVDAVVGGAVFEEEEEEEAAVEADEAEDEEETLEESSEGASEEAEEIRITETEEVEVSEGSPVEVASDDALRMTPQERADAEADAAHDDAVHDAGRGEHVDTDTHEHGDGVHDRENELIEASAGAQATPSAPMEDDVILLPGETRSPRSATAPREDFAPRESARIGSGNPRSRFQRPFRGGGRDRGRDNRGGGDRGPRPGGPSRGGRPSGRFERRPSGPGGPRHDRGYQGGRSGPPRRPQLISEMLKAGQDVVIQIAKEPLGKKGARITSHVALPGRFLVYMPTVHHTGVSRKIISAENRSRLRRLVSEAGNAYPGGFIVRTAAGEATDDEIRADIDFLGKTWNEIKERSEQRKAPALLHRDLDLVERMLRDYVSDDFSAIWIDNEEEYGKVVEFVSRFQPKLVNRVKLYTKETPIFEEFGIQHELDKALRAKVWLKSGGYIVINHTEALVAIDVNTGKFVGKGSTRLEDTIVKTNIEAVKEIVRQIRLRDLGGIIVVDFIDMEERRNREKVLSALQQALEQDKAPSKALSFNEFGLVCITRKRTKQALERVLCQPCPYCTGSGMVKSSPTLCYEIQAEARKMAAADHESPNLTLRVHPEIAKALKTRESMLIDELEQTTHKHVIIQSDATLHWEQYDIY